MRNPFRRKATNYSDKVTADLVIGTPDGVHNVRVTIEYNNPRAGLAAIVKLAEGQQLHDVAVEMGVHTCPTPTAAGEAAAR